VDTGALTWLQYRGNVLHMAIAQSRLTVQGQISVPAEVRRKLGISPGATIEWHEEGESIVVRRVGRFTSADLHAALFPKPPRRRTLAELRDGLKAYAKRRHARR
jgi:AbrB family looped-hinge helix DNA binding protein